MKKLLLLIAFLGVCNFGFSQKYMDEIAEKSCVCMKEISDNADQEQYYMEFGLCMIEAALPYKKKIKKDYKIDLDKIDTQGEALGEIIGAKMVSVCPDELVRLSKVSSGDNIEEPVNAMSERVKGTIVSISDNPFVIFSVKDEAGKTSKFYWLNFIESSSDLVNDYKKMKDEQVQITFSVQEFFDARIGEYKNFNIIHSLETIE